MKKLILTLLSTLFFNLNLYPNPISEIDWDNLIEAIIHVESRGNEKAISKNGKFVGALQISKIMVDDCNRIIGNKKYEYEHRLDKGKSIEMFHIIQKFYNPQNDLMHAIRLWKGGHSWKTNSIPTLDYYNKVSSIYKKLQEYEKNN